MSLITNTVYDEKLDKEVLKYDYLDLKIQITISPMPALDSDPSFNNMIIEYIENEKEPIYIVIFKEDLEEFGDILFKTIGRHKCEKSISFISKISPSNMFNYSLEYVLNDSKIPAVGIANGTIDCSFDYYQICSEKKKFVSRLHLSREAAIKLLANISKSCEQQSSVSQASHNLENVHKIVKKQMHENKIEKLHFDIKEKVTKSFGSNGLFNIMIVEITPIGYDGNIVGDSFLRMMHLTGVEKIDWQTYSTKDYLSCPFEFSDELKELGKEFMKRKEEESIKALRSRVDDVVN